MTNALWTLDDAWNKVVSDRQERELKPRDYIYASELGGALVDVWLKMKGVGPSNKPNQRSLRKFFAGNIWEDVTKLVLASAGILIKTQEHLTFQYPTLLEVRGRLDHYAGGIPDPEKVKHYFTGLKTLENDIFEDNGQPSNLEHISLRVAEMLKAKFPEGLQKQILEIKSSSSFMFESRVKKNAPDIHHAIQLFHYLKSKGEEWGQISYICKDDSLMKTFFVNGKDSKLEAEYKKRIEEITKCIKSNEQPPKEKEVDFDEVQFKFTKNWEVEYSNYLTMLYGYREPEDYRERWDNKISNFNRVFKRVITGQKMTPLNLEVIAECKAYFPKYDEYVDKAKEALKKDPSLAVEDENDSK
jgi:hypothetical protein